MAMWAAILLLVAPQCVIAKQQTPLHAGLTVARVAEPAKVAQVLRELRLDSASHYRGDLAALNSDEHAEMVAALQGGGIALGDRSRLRLWVESTEAGGDHRIWLKPRQRLSSTYPRRLQLDGSEDQAAEADKGVSSDTIAIILTGLSAVAGYIFQARQASSAEHNQETLARESERVQKEADIMHQQRQVQTQ
jgi:hypothetical protein